jgi:hypothetical protein
MVTEAGTTPGMTTEPGQLKWSKTICLKQRNAVNEN